MGVKLPTYPPSKTGGCVPVPPPPPPSENTSQFTQVFMQLPPPLAAKCGWVCPKCGSVYAPYVTECPRCSPKDAGDTKLQSDDGG